MSTTTISHVAPLIPRQGVPLLTRTIPDQQRPRFVIHIRLPSQAVTGHSESLEDRPSPTASFQTVATSPDLVRVAEHSHAAGHQVDIDRQREELKQLKIQQGYIESAADRNKRWKTQKYSAKIAEVSLLTTKTDLLLEEKNPSIGSIQENLEKISTALNLLTITIGKKQARTDFIKM
jgi:hypothetical protein